MRPLLLKGHERAIVHLTYNREGDLLFTCSKDHTPTVWRAHNGERLGTYNGHSGAVWYADPTGDSKYLLTASADSSVKLWEVETGLCLFTFPTKAPARCSVWAEGEKQFAVACDAFGADITACIRVYDFSGGVAGCSTEPILTIVDPADKKLKVTKLLWLPLNQGLLAAYENGLMKVWDPVTGALKREWQAHSKSITSLSYNKEKTLLISSSQDFTARLWLVRDLTADTVAGSAAGAAVSPYKVYLSDKPVNGAAIAPDRELVILGGGQEARNVTTTDASEGKFHNCFYHLVFEKELARLKGHFGPINTLAYNPDGKSFSSGAEDGYIRVHIFDDKYADVGMKEEKELDLPATQELLKHAETIRTGGRPAAAGGAAGAAGAAAAAAPLTSEA